VLVIEQLAGNLPLSIKFIRRKSKQLWTILHYLKSDVGTTETVVTDLNNVNFPSFLPSDFHCLQRVKTVTGLTSLLR
jgi:hypothetical protein